MSQSILYVVADGGCTGNGKKDAVASYGYCIISSADIELELIKQDVSCVVGKGSMLKNIDKSSLCCYDGSGVVDTGDNLPVATSNRGELTAMLKAFERLEFEGLSGDVILISDSQYSLNTVDTWCRNWLKDPVKHKIEEKKNMDLVIKIKDSIDNWRKKHRVTLVHVRGHGTAPVDVASTDYLYWYLNNRVDAMCQKVLLEVKK
jgi:ribonuclease HI